MYFGRFMTLEQEKQELAANRLMVEGLRQLLGLDTYQDAKSDSCTAGPRAAHRARQPA
jgi:hypothetical protein